MPLHVILDSPATHELTKTELDIGVITNPYIAIAHCVRAGFCVSHALRTWVRITISFDALGPFALTLDSTTLRYMGTDERSILHIILRGQQAYQSSKPKIPHGITLADKSVKEILETLMNQNAVLLIPGEQATWQNSISKAKMVVMYCPLSHHWNQELMTAFTPQYYWNRLQPDLAILEVVHTMDYLNEAVQKD